MLHHYSRDSERQGTRIKGLLGSTLFRAFDDFGCFVRLGGEFPFHHSLGVLCHTESRVKTVEHYNI